MTTEEKEARRKVQQCRRDVLTSLAVREPNALTVAQLRVAVKRDYGTDYSEDEIGAAVSFLERMTPAEVERIADRFGSDHTYRTTTAGQLAHERGEG